MDLSMIEQWVWTALGQLWSFIAVSYLVFQMGAISKRIAKKLGWQGSKENPSWFDIWLRAAPFPAGAVFGIIPFPTLHVIQAIGEGDWSFPEVVARMGWFMLAGALCGQMYELITFTFDAIKKKLGAREKKKLAMREEEEEAIEDVR